MESRKCSNWISTLPLQTCTIWSSRLFSVNSLVVGIDAFLVLTPLQAMDTPQITNANGVDEFCIVITKKKNCIFFSGAMGIFSGLMYLLYFLFTVLKVLSDCAC